jgi:hypothetical protein
MPEYYLKLRHDHYFPRYFQSYFSVLILSFYTMQAELSEAPLNKLLIKKNRRGVFHFSHSFNHFGITRLCAAAPSVICATSHAWDHGYRLL